MPPAGYGPYDSRGFPLPPPPASPHMQDAARRNADLAQRYEDLARQLDLMVVSERAYVTSLRHYETQATMNSSPWINVDRQLDEIKKSDFTMERGIRAETRLAFDKAREARDTQRLIGSAEAGIYRLSYARDRALSEAVRLRGMR